MVISGCYTTGGSYNGNTDNPILQGDGCPDCPDAWSKLLTNGRFDLVMNGEAVIDHETCLVWEKSPTSDMILWNHSHFHCYRKEIGGRKGWRLPHVEELATLVDSTQFDDINPTLPVGHLFQNVQTGRYWTATTSPGGAGFSAYVVNFGNANVLPVDITLTNHIWCVRGGHGDFPFFE